MATEEYELIRAKIHWIVYVKPVLELILIFIIASFFEGILIWALILGGLLNLLLSILKYKLQNLIVTNQRVYGKARYGFLYLISSELNVRLDKVDNASIKTGIWGSIFGYGTVRIMSSNGQFTWRRISNYKAIISTLNSAQDDYNMRGSNQITNSMQQINQQQLQMLQTQTLAQMNMAGMLAGNQQTQVAGMTRAVLSQNTFGTLPDDIVDERLPMAARPALPQTHGEQKAIGIVRQKPGNERVIRREMERPMWQKGCPVLVSRAYIADTNDNKQIDLNLEMTNLDSRSVTAIYLDIRGYNVLKEEKCDMKDVPYLDLKMEQGQTCKMPDPIDLPDNTIRSFDICIRHVVFSDETLWNYEGEEWLTPIAEQKMIPQKYMTDIYNITQEKTAHKNTYQYQKYKYYPVGTQDYWLCACGQFNKDLICVGCNEDKDIIEQYFSEAYLETENRMRTKREAEEAEERRIRREKEAEERRIRNEEERIKREEEERLRLEKETAERAAKEEARRQKIESIKNSAISLVDTAGRKTKEIGDRIVSAGKTSEARSEHEEAMADGNEAHFCMNCGKPLASRDLFCQYCGTKVE